jgi:hypothetical protein
MGGAGVRGGSREREIRVLCLQVVLHIIETFPARRGCKHHSVTYMVVCEVLQGMSGAWLENGSSMC